MRVRTTRTRKRLRLLAGTIASLASAGLLTAGPAYASNEGVYSYTSDDDGYGFAQYISGPNGYGTLKACDRGDPDGLRTVAHLFIWGSGDYYWAWDKYGSNGDCGDAWTTVPEPEEGTHMSLEVCLRDGPEPYGDMYCRETDFYLT
jgi:hypothetical protein